MKKLNLFFLALLGLLIFICCSSDEALVTTEQIQINPPRWIQGSGRLNNSFSNGHAFRFRSNDVTVIQPATQQSLRGQLEIYFDAGQSLSTTEEISESTYKIINFPTGESTVYSFTKVAPNEIVWDVAPSTTFTKH